MKGVHLFTLFTFDLDRIAPTISSAEIGNVAQNKIVLTAFEVLDDSYIASTAAFSISGITGGANATNVTIVGSTITIILDADAIIGETVQISYTKPLLNAIRDLAGNQMASFVNFAVTNNVTNLIRNSGLGLDWVDSNADGIANGWTAIFNVGETAQIVTGNGFTGNAQRYNHLKNAGTNTIFRIQFTAVNNATYRLTGKYRSSGTAVRMYISTTNWFTLTIPINIGNALPFDYSVVNTVGDGIKTLDFVSINTADNLYFECDEVKLVRTA